ncbi:MAG: Ger(x)C family spore germination protein [Chloroflexota bacterium]
MTTSQRRAAIVVIIVITAIALTGCWDRAEINDTGFVLAMGVSRTDKGEFRVAVEIAMPGKLGKTSQGGGAGGEASGTTATLIREATGATLHAALGRITLALGRTIDESHCNILLVSEQLLQDGSLAEVMDWLTRFYQIRREKIVLVTDVEPTAVLEASPQLEPTQGLNLYKALVTIKWDCLPSYQSTVRDIMLRQNTYGVHVALGRVTLADEPDGSKAVVGNGIAILDGGRLLGMLTKDEARFANMILNHSRGSTLILELSTPALVDEITRPTPGYHGGDVEGSEVAPTAGAHAAMHVTHSRTSIKVRLEGGVPVIDVNIKLNAQIVEMGMPLALGEPEAIKKLNRVMSDFVAERVLATIAATQSYPKGGDIFFIGEMIHDRFPGVWHAINDQWDQYYKTLKFNVKVDGSITSTGRSLAPSVPHR